MSAEGAPRLDAVSQILEVTSPAPGGSPLVGWGAPGERTIAVLSPLLAGNFFSRVMAGITGAAAASGASVVGIQTLNAHPTSLSHQNTAPDYRHLVSWDHIAGVVALVNAVRPEFLQGPTRCVKPVVSVSHTIEGLSVPVVAADNRSGMEIAVDHLVAEHGHRRIAFVGNMLQDDIRERYEAFCAALAKHGIGADPDLLIEVQDNVEAGGEAAAQTLLERGLPCTAVAVATDYNAIGMMAVLTERGVSLPRDLAIVSFDDIIEASTLSPALSTVRQDLELIGATAFRLLESRIEGRRVLPGHYRLPTTFVCRESCGCDALERRFAIETKQKERPRVQLRRSIAKLLVAPGAEPARVAEVQAAVEDLADVLENPATVTRERLEAIAARLASHELRWDRISAIAGSARAFAEQLPDDGDVPGGLQVARERICADVAVSLTHRVLSRGAFERTRLEQSLRDEYALSMDLLQRHEKDPRGLHFLSRTPARAGCLALWVDGDPKSGMLEVLSVYGADGVSPLSPGMQIPMGEFPPRALIDVADGAAGEMTVVLPVRTESNDWGVLALVSHIETNKITGRDFYFQCAALLSAVLEEEALLSSLLARQDELRVQQDELRRSEERYALAATAASDGLWDWNVALGTIYFSERWKEMVGCEPDEVGTSPDEWFGRVHPDDRVALMDAVDACLRGESDSLVSEHRLRATDGSYRWTRCRALAVPGPPAFAIRLVGSTTDITVQWEFEQRLRHQALHDALTGLPNRSLVLDRATQMLASAKRHQSKVAALFIDLDDFKEVNDSLGHSIGDELLIAVATRLRHAVRDADTVGRLGGDEFVVLVDEASPDTDSSLVAERVRDVLRSPFELGGREHLVSASIGVASTDDGDAEDLLRDADIAMYQAKSAGKNRFVIFQPEMQLLARDRLRLEMDLATAILDGQLRVFYQPIVELDGLAVEGMEALVRWQHPHLGLLGPNEFIPIAEANGRLILDLGRYVLGEACRAASSWHANGARLAVSVNISARHLDSDDLLVDVEDALAASDLAPEWLVLEVTETAIMRDAHTSVPRLAALKRLGVRIAIDDFGTGYSSLAYLRQLPVDVLKIDRSFITSIPESLEAGAVVQTLISLGQTLELEIVAEGIELQGQLDALRKAGCHTAQGFFFARPLDEASLGPFIASTVGTSDEVPSPHR